MIAQTVIDNFFAWTIQVFVIGLMGALLPLLVADSTQQGFGDAAVPHTGNR